MTISSPRTLLIWKQWLACNENSNFPLPPENAIWLCCGGKCLLSFIPAQWSFQSSETLVTLSWLITTGGNFFVSRVRSHEGIKQRLEEDSCHPKQEELVLCNRFYSTSGETDCPLGGSAATGIFWNVVPASFSVLTLCQRYFHLTFVPIPEMQFPWNGSSTAWAPQAASGHSLLLRQISNFNLGSQVEIIDSHHEQKALAWACSESPLCRGGWSCLSSSLVMHPLSNYREV